MQQQAVEHDDNRFTSLNQTSAPHESHLGGSESAEGSYALKDTDDHSTISSFADYYRDSSDYKRGTSSESVDGFFVPPPPVHSAIKFPPYLGDISKDYRYGLESISLRSYGGDEYSPIVSHNRNSRHRSTHSTSSLTNVAKGEDEETLRDLGELGR